MRGCYECLISFYSANIRIITDIIKKNAKKNNGISLKISVFVVKK